MGRIVTILLISTVAYSQRQNPEAVSIFKAELYVQQVYKNVKTCHQQSVVWGFKADSICFNLDEVRCFTGVTLIEDKKYNPNDATIIAASHLKEKHSIRFVRGDDGFIIFIINLEKNFPHFVISTRDICSR